MNQPQWAVLQHAVADRDRTIESLRKRLASAVALIDEQKAEIARLRAQWEARWDEANKEGV